jgi:hypothetical protein
MSSISKGLERRSGSAVTLSCLAALNLSPAMLLAATAHIAIAARVVKPVEITVDSSPHFGTMAHSGGVTHVDPSDRYNPENGLSPAAGAPQAGRITIRGQSSPVSISIEDSAVNLSNGSEQVTVNNFNLGQGAPRVTVTPQATVTVPVGATLSSKPGQAEGIYRGITRVSANFQ